MDQHVTSLAKTDQAHVSSGDSLNVCCVYHALAVPLDLEHVDRARGMKKTLQGANPNRIWLNLDRLAKEVADLGFLVRPDQDHLIVADVADDLERRKLFQKDRKGWRQHGPR